MLADIETNETLPADEMQLCPSELGPVAIFPMSATRRRIVATIENTAEDAPSLDLVRKILVQRAEAARQLAGSFSGRVELRLTSVTTYSLFGRMATLHTLGTVTMQSQH